MAAADALSNLTTGQIVGLWLQAAFTLAIFSFLWSDNPVYKLAEHIFVGISAGYGVVLVWHQAVLPLLLFKLLPQISGGAELSANYWVVIPGALGVLMLTRFFPKYDWLSRWPIAFVVGLYAGAGIPAVVQASILEQSQATLEPLKALHGPLIWGSPPVGSDGASVLTAFNAVLLLTGVICTLSYFYFSLPHTGILGVTSRIGIWFLMVAFGAGFGNTVMARVSLLIGRVQFLLEDWWRGTGIRLFGGG
ncbi:MAG: hypothetical protein HPY69_02215 [Armatimonadetes bacterium]|nr:hypothetical protein [Armatimonadota bacterium]